MLTSFSWVKNILRIALPVGIAFYMTYPLLFGDYIYGSAEYELYKSFMVNFIETLKRGELPTWNEYVGCGQPVPLFGLYPINQNTLFYMLFGYSDFTCFMTRGFNLAILLLTFIYACKYLELSYPIALAGALTYFSVNFVTRFLITDGLGNLLLVPPLMMVLIIKIVAENKTKDILIFSLVYIFWLSGGHITYVYMHMVMLFIVYWIAIFVFYKFEAFKLENLRRIIPLYCVLFIIPLLAVMYQYYLIYDVISSSNRFREGLIVSPLEATAWKQLLVSFQSSSYFWFGLFSISIYAILKFLPLHRTTTEGIRFTMAPRELFCISAILLGLTATGFQFTGTSSFIADYIPILNSQSFRIALLLYFAIHLALNKMRSHFYFSLKDSFVFIVYVSLLSYYFYSPENIPGDKYGYDYDLFRELSVPFQILFTLAVLLSSADYQKNKTVRIMVLSAIALYLLRSHLTIPLLRFSGFVWYATRDGTIFSIFFAILFAFGLKHILSYFSRAFKNSEDLTVKFIKYGFLIFILLLFVQDSFNKFYKGTSHRYVYPNKRMLAKSQMEKWVIDGRKEVDALNSKLLSLARETNHFYRLFSPENHYLWLTGNLQQYKIHEAFIYDSTIPKTLQDLYDETVLKKKPSRDLKDVMPYFLFTRHVHAGLNLRHTEIKYRDFFMFLAKDNLEYLQNQNIEFLWDIMQVKYLIVGSEFSNALENFTNKEYYKLISKYPNLHLYLYETVKNKSYSKLAILPLEGQQGYDEIISLLNSKDIEVLKALYSKLVFLDFNTADFALLGNKHSNASRYYEIFSIRKAILIDFESWNHSWGLKVNDENKELHKAFQMFKGIALEPGLNRIELTYNLKYFKGLFVLSIFTILLYIILLGRLHYAEN